MSEQQLEQESTKHSKESTSIRDTEILEEEITQALHKYQGLDDCDAFIDYAWRRPPATNVSDAGAIYRSFAMELMEILDHALIILKDKDAILQDQIKRRPEYRDITEQQAYQGLLCDRERESTASFGKSLLNVQSGGLGLSAEDVRLRQQRLVDVQLANTEQRIENDLARKQRELEDLPKDAEGSSKRKTTERQRFADKLLSGLLRR